MGRAPCCDKANVKRGPWSSEEDAKLKAYIENYGTGGNWIALPPKIGLKRCGKSCRLRWLNYLRPNIKHGGFTDEEDSIICSLYISIGSRWSIIAAQLPGRTDNDIKNYWNTRLKKKLLGRRKQSNRNNNNNRLLISSGQEAKDNFSNGTEDNNLHNLSSSAIERLQLHMHLQSLQINPFAFYNNPSLFMNQNQHILMQETPTLSADPVVVEQDYRDVKRVDELVNSITTGVTSTETSFNAMKMESDHVMVQNMGIQTGEYDGLLDNKSSGFQTGEFDCFKEMDGSTSKDNIGWWNNEFETNSSTSNSWDSTNMFHQVEEMYQDYAIGSYSMQ